MSLLSGSSFHLSVALSLIGLLPAIQAQQPAVAAYVFPQAGALQPGQVDAEKLTRINYAFAGIVDGKMVESSAGEGANLAVLTSLRKENPSLTILISVGGWLGSGAFSDMALTEQSRAVFIDSVMEFLKRYSLDGLDVDWEYPGQAGASNHFRSEDKQNFTLLLQELRARFTREGRQVHRRLILTIAAGSDDDYLAHTEMKKVAQAVDAVNLMTYDFYEPDSDLKTGNHAALFTDPADPKQVSADASVRAYEAAGVPAAKIILGAPFYGHVWGQVADVDHGLFQPGKPVPNLNATYGSIVQTMLGHGYTRYWDDAAKAPYLYNAEKQIFVSYEDPESLKLKCAYVQQHKLGGVMFWSYFNDPSGELLGTIDGVLHAKAVAGGN